MKNILLINGDLFKTESTDFLIEAYRRGAVEGGHVCHGLAIVDLLFNYNKQFSTQNAIGLESDLRGALRELQWANHIVLFCPVFKSYVPSKISGFFDRLFVPSQHGGRSGAQQTFYGKSGRIVSVLDEELFEEWNLYKKPTFMAIKKDVFERSHLNPVLTSTIGYLHRLDNNYSTKWARKLEKFGLKGI